VFNVTHPYLHKTLSPQLLQFCDAAINFFAQ
jgi:hypothetical protein